MTKEEVDYNSLREKLSEIMKRTDTSYKRLIKAKRTKGNLGERELESIPATSAEGGRHPDLIEAETQRTYDYLVGGKLSELNNSLLKGNFKHAVYSINEIKGYLQDNNRLMENYSANEKEKLVKGVNKRIERGMKYLEKHPSNENIRYMKEILNSSKAIEGKLEGKPSSGLEKSLSVVSIGSIIAGIFFLSPNLTGNVIGNLTRSSSNILGIGLFILGIIGVFFTLKR